LPSVGGTAITFANNRCESSKCSWQPNWRVYRHH